MNLKDELRILLGNPSTTEFSVDAAGVAVDSALLELSKFKGPVKTSYYTETETDKQDYDLPVDCIKIIDCLWGSTLVAWNTFRPLYLPETYGRASITAEWFENPGLRTIYQLKVVQAIKAADQSWEYLENNKIRLYPAPSNTGDLIYFLYRTLLTESSLSKYDRESLLIYAEAKARKMALGIDVYTRIGETNEDKSVAWGIIRDLEKRFYSRVFVGGTGTRS